VAALAFLESEPTLGRLTLGHLLGAPPRRPVPRVQVLAALTSVLADSGASSERSRGFPALAREIFVGGVLSVVHSRLGDPGEPLSALVNPLMSMIVLPSLGSEEAAAELERDVPESLAPLAASRNGYLSSEDPLRGLRIRLTHRTATVIAAIADSPGLSNVQVSARAGVRDQGQMSKLLARLAGHGLIRNTGGGRAKGAVNAWWLTRRGEAVFAAIDSHRIGGLVR
jgi:hypothetical protein